MSPVWVTVHTLTRGHGGQSCPPAATGPLGQAGQQQQQRMGRMCPSGLGPGQELFMLIELISIIPSHKRLLSLSDQQDLG